VVFGSQPKKILALMALVFLIFSAAVGSAGYFFYQRQKESVKQEKWSELRAIADLKAKEIADWRKEQMDDAQAILENPFLLQSVRLLMEHPANTALRGKVLAWMTSLQKYEGFENVSLLDTQGLVRLSVTKNKRLFHAAAPQMIEESARTRRIIFTDLHKNESDDGVHIDLIIPIFPLTGQSSSPPVLLLLQIDPDDFLFPLIQEWPTPSKSAETLLIRREGEEVVFLNELRHRKGTALTLRLPVSQKGYAAVMAARGAEGIVEGHDYRGIPVLAAIRKIPDSPWFLVSKVDQKEIYAPVRNHAAAVSIVVGILIIGAALGTSLFWRGERLKYQKERYAAELERITLARRFDYLSRYANDIILLIDQDLKIVEANERAVTSYGYTRDELLQMNIRQLTPVQERSALDAQIRQIEQSNGFIYETVNRRKDGTTFPVEISSRIIPVGENKFYQNIIREISDRKRAEEALKGSHRFLEIAHTHAKMDSLLKEFLAEVKNLTGCAAAGIRILDEEGRIPYQVYEGFSRSFFELESPLSIRSDQCMCINVIKGDIDRNLPFYTEGGSFYMNGTTRFLATVSEEEKGQTRNVCNQFGYESVALVPIRFKTEVLGLIHVADPRENRVPLRTVEALEKAAMQLGTVLERVRAEEKLQQSEHLLRAIIDNANGVVWVKDLEGRFLIINRYVEGMLGRPQEQMVGRTVFDLFPQDVAKTYTDNDRQVLDSGKAMEFEESAMLRDGEHTYLSVKFPLCDSNGRIYALGAICAEITDRKQVEKSLRERTEVLRTVVETSPLAIAVTDLQGQVTLWNRAAEVSFGWTADEVIGKQIPIVPSDKGDEIRQVRQEIIEGKSFFDFETERVRKDGGRFPVSFSAAALRDSNGVVTGILAIVSDITERKRVEESLKQSEENARRLARENESMAEIGRIISSTLNIEEVYEPFSEEVKKILPFDRIVVNFIDAEKGLVRNVYMAGGQIQDRQVGKIYPLEGSGNAEMVRTGSTLLIQTEDFSRYQDRFPMLLSTFQAGFQSIMNVPLFSKGKVIGGLLLRSRKPYAYRDRDVRLAERIGSQIAGAVANAQLYGELVDTEKERVALEEQLHQSQKMEAIGRLAGGIAHDFNNLLTVIRGYDEISLMELKEGDPLRANMEEIRKAANRAADLTRQLLAFSRRQIMEFKVLDLNTVLKDLSKMVHRIIGEHIELVTLFPEDLGRVKADPGQVQQVLMNLVVNARDAMPNGGRLTIETANAELDEAYARRHVAVAPGRYVMLSVSDTGAGMTPEVKDRIFEPFFTTKERGKGTGLGLSTVYGIVKQSGGDIWVYSEAGKGSTFKIYLPRVDAPLSEAGKSIRGEEIPRGNETILLAEDEEEVRRLSARILEKQGYRVLTASQGEEALEVCKAYTGPIHLLVTDVVMPKMSGRELAKRVGQFHPETRVMYMSGYTDDAIVHFGVLDEGMEYVQKPFTVDGLARRVREVLDK
jgi:PAS domain S-box-containing protein